MLDNKSQKEALLITRKAISGYLKTGQKPVIAVPKSRILSQVLGAFVTLHSINDHRLCGCIGCFEPEKPLYQVIQDMAIAAACKDSRFPPLKTEKIGNISIEISVMTPKRKVKNWQDIKLGKQGVVIRKDGQGGTFLPQVARETGWSLEKFLSELCVQKAGLPPNCYKDPAVDIFVFDVQIFSED